MSSNEYTTTTTGNIDSLFWLPATAKQRDLDILEQERALFGPLESKPDIERMCKLLDLPECTEDPTPTCDAFTCTHFPADGYEWGLSGAMSAHIRQITGNTTAYCFCKTHWEIFHPILEHWRELIA